jgi:hypothetical protein
MVVLNSQKKIMVFLLKLWLMYHVLLVHPTRFESGDLFQ